MLLSKHIKHRKIFCSGKVEKQCLQNYMNTFVLVRKYIKKMRALLTVEALHTDGSGVCIHYYCHFRAWTLDSLYPWKATFRSITVQMTLWRAVPSFPRRMRHQEQPLRTNRLHSPVANMQTSSLQQTAESNTFHNLVLQHRKGARISPTWKNPGDVCAEREVFALTQKQNIFFPFSLPQLWVCQLSMLA